MAVRCSSWHENPDGSTVCDECGEPLTGGSASAQAGETTGARAPGTQRCLSCNATNPEGEVFCTNCGAKLG
ncbi:zinc-ribbon domain-containing protein [Streptomyces sp. NPDC057543]|uniref:zinc-ribbon domain-containing protein n=1 Tax=Streptomyces sp. NPDC057543 TaxID=3346163 RepID=UPI00368291FC